LIDIDPHLWRSS